MASHRVRRGFALPLNPKVGDEFVHLGAPDPDALCVTPGVWSSHGGAITRDTIAIGVRTGNVGTTFLIGSYEFGSSDDDFNPGINFGDQDIAHGSHFFLVQAAGAGGGDTTVRITGASILSGIRIPGDTEDLVVSDSAPAGTYYSTVKIWNGEISATKISGPDLLMNHGLATWYDRGSTNFMLTSISAQLFGGANDAGFDMQLLLHSANGWTYVPDGEPVPAAPVASSLTDMAPEHELANGKEWQWTRPTLNLAVAGASGEGIIGPVISTANNAVAHGTVYATVVSQA